MTKVKNSVVQLYYSYRDYCLKATALNIICFEHFSDVGDETCLVLIVFVFLRDPTSSWLLFNKLKNKACRHPLIVAQFRDRYIHG